jgi:hypothetical protein
MWPKQYVASLHQQIIDAVTSILEGWIVERQIVK